MTQIIWNEDLNTGIDIIDNQHKRIVEYINQLIAHKDTGDKTKINEVLDQLVDYTLSHFIFEESLMLEAGYPYINAHKRVHQLFAKRIDSYVQRFRMGEDITQELTNTLKTWLINHIRSDDRDYVSLVKDKLKTTHQDSGWIARNLKKVFG